MGVFGKLIQCTMPIEHSLLHHPPSCVLRHCPSHYYPVTFQDICAQVFQIYINRKFTDPHFQYIYLPAHQNSYSKLSFRQLDVCRHKHMWEYMLLFWYEYIAFLGHTKWGTRHSESDQISTAKIFDHRLQLWTIQPPMSLSTHKPMHEQCWHNPHVHTVFTSRVHVFVLHPFRYSLISVHPVETNSTKIRVLVILYTLWWDVPMFYHWWCWNYEALISTSKNLFVIQ